MTGESVSGKVALVTGAASGNGREIALDLARHGASTIVIADIREDPREGGATTASLIEAQTAAKALFVACDVTRLNQIEQAVAVADDAGGLDILVNNAGLFAAHDFLGVTEDQFDVIMAVNVKGTYFASQTAARSMRAHGRGGSIVNIGSVSAMAGAAAYSLYCTSKGAVRLLTQSLAAALGPDQIRVNMVCPGVVETAMTTGDVPIFGTGVSDQIMRITPLRHVGTPGDIADAVTYLAGDNAKWISGAVLVIDGGRTSTLPGAFTQTAAAAAR